MVFPVVVGETSLGLRLAAPLTVYKETREMEIVSRHSKLD
jgi:hypothetical protein